MIFATPEILPEQEAKLEELDQVRDELGYESGRPVPWIGALRRSVRSSSIQGSTSIEGFQVAPEVAESLTIVTESGKAEDEDQMAIASYARAMDHVGAMATDPGFRWYDRVILDLHFDACHFQMDREPGRWRSGPVAVTANDGSLEYRGPDADRVPELMAEVVRWLERGDLEANPVVRAAMAHLHVVSVHPFSDGNGRVARIVQSLVLALNGPISPEFSSIEEYLGDNTPAYYEALRKTQGGSYLPDRDASGWVDFCIEAHLAQARQRLAQIRAAGVRWGLLERLVEGRDWPDRLVIALEQSLLGGTDRMRYGAEAGISSATASADFRRLLDAALVERHGRGRNTRYRASKTLRSQVAQAAEHD